MISKLKRKFLFPLLLLTTAFPMFYSDSADAAEIPCGRPNYDSTTDQGLFLWQNCGTKQWFFRAANGSSEEEFRVEGEYKFSKPATSVVGFQLDPGVNGNGDILNASDLTNIVFRFRVFSSGLQDGIDFTIPDDTLACLKISVPSDIPVIMGADNNVVTLPANIDKLNHNGCLDITAYSKILLLDE